MGLDGFSMGNLGLNTEMTSAQMANQAEQIAQKESEIKVKDVTKTAEDDGVKRKEEEDSSGNESFAGGSNKKKKGDQENNDNVVNLTEIENADLKEFAIRINKKTDLIELFNKEDGRILETITAKDLMDLISKLDNASGILVNRKI